MDEEFLNLMRSRLAAIKTPQARLAKECGYSPSAFSLFCTGSVAVPEDLPVEIGDALKRLEARAP